MLHIAGPRQWPHGLASWTPAEMSTQPSTPPTVLAQQGVGITTNALQQWLISNGVTVVVVLIGLALLVYALRGDASRVLTVVGLSVVGLAFLALGTVNGAAAGVGHFFLGLIGVGGGR